jgi:uncharacterized protein YciI
MFCACYLVSTSILFRRCRGFGYSSIAKISMSNNNKESSLPATEDFYCLRCLYKDSIEQQQLGKEPWKSHKEYIEKTPSVALGGSLLDKNDREVGRLYLLQSQQQENISQWIQKDPLHSIWSDVNVTIFKRVKPFPVTWPTTPVFVVYCLDDPNNKSIRVEHRPQHRGWWQNESRVVTVGPMAAAFSQDDSLIGSLFFVTGESVDEVQQWANQDPYAKAGLFQQVKVYQWNCHKRNK